MDLQNRVPTQNVVSLPDLDRRVPPRSDPVLYDPELGISVDLGDGEEEPVLHRLISDHKGILEEAELWCLLYVALTRAGDHLILTRTDAGTNRLCGLTLLRPGLELAGIDFVPVLSYEPAEPMGGREGGRGSYGEVRSQRR